MTYERLLVLVMCCGLAVACSKTGPDDGEGGSGGVPTGAGGMGGASIGTGGLGGRATARGGRGGTVFTATELPCLQMLFADCPTEPGTCQWISVGIGGAPGNSSGHLCYASETTVNTFVSERDCNTDPTSRMRYFGQVHKPDGTLCYTFERTCECSSGCEINQFTFRSGSGEIVASGQGDSLSCVTGESCGPGGGAGGASGICIPYLPGFQCVEGTCP